MTSRTGLLYSVIGAIAAVVIVMVSIQSAGTWLQHANQATANAPTEEELAELERIETLRQDEYSRAYNAEFAALEAKESTVRAIVYADPRVQEYISGAYSSQSDLVRADLTGTGTDVLLIYVVGERLPIEGDWNAGYKKTYTGIFEVKVSVKGGQIVSIEKIPNDDVVRVETFTDSEKKALEIAFANPEIASAVEGKDIMVAGVMSASFGKDSDCPPASCVHIFLEQPAKREFLSFFFNTSPSKVFKLGIGEGW